MGRYCLIGSGNVMVDDDFTGDRGAINPDQYIVDAPSNFDDHEWVIGSGGWRDKVPPVSALKTMLDGLVASSAITEEVAAAIIAVA